jgi:hypothetical protein
MAPNDMTDHFRHPPLDVVEFQQALPRFHFMHHQTADAIDERAGGTPVGEQLDESRNGLGQCGQELATHLAEALDLGVEYLLASGGIHIVKPRDAGDTVRIGRRHLSFDHNPPQSPKHDIGTAIRQHLGLDDLAGPCHGMDRRAAIVILLPSRPQKDHCQPPLPGETIREHLPVAGLKDMQRQQGVGKEDHVGQRKDGKFHIGFLVLGFGSWVLGPRSNVSDSNT